MKKYCFLLGLVCCILHTEAKQFFPANHPYISYMGRIDFSNPALPRFWQPGVCVLMRFSGSSCQVIVKDQVLWGKNHNYLELVLDGHPVRLQTKAATDTIQVGEHLKKGIHELILCKNTEANIGYLEFAGLLCDKLHPASAMPVRKIECIGNSITCGTGSDMAAIPCGKGVWHDQHNAWMSYGAILSRALKAQWHLSSVSGIGLMHSCCNLEIIMPQVFDKISMRENAIDWDFKRYQPDLITVCLGQNDGVQDSAAFVHNYSRFIQQLRGYYPSAHIVLLSSPMADNTLRSFMKKVLPVIVAVEQQTGDKKITQFIFEKQYSSGCDYHPSLEEHKEIARLLGGYIRKYMKW